MHRRRYYRRRTSPLVWLYIIVGLGILGLFSELVQAIVGALS